MENSTIYLNYLISVRNDFFNRGLIKQAEKVQNDINKILQEKQNTKQN